MTATSPLTDLDRAERLALAGHRLTPPDTLAALAHDPDPAVRRAVAGNRASPVEVLTRLAADDEAPVRIRVAGNPSTPAHVITTLATDEDRAVRQRVLANPSAPVPTVVAALDDPDTRVTTAAFAAIRRRQAWPALPPDRACTAADQVSLAVRRLIASSPKTPTAVVDHLLAHETTQVQAASNPAASPAALFRASRSVISTDLALALAANPSTPTAMLDELSRRADPPALRTLVAAHPSTPVDVLVGCASSPSWYVRAATAGNPATPPTILEQLAADPSWAVRWAVAANVATPPSLLGPLAISGSAVALAVATNPAAPAGVVDQLVADPSVWVRGTAVGHGEASAEALARACATLAEPAWLLARAVTNLRCPDDVREVVGTWLALGGAAGHDIRFDPVTGRGNPGPTNRAARLNLAALADSDAHVVVDAHPLWPVRVARLSRSDADITAGIEDPSPEARRQIIRLPGIDPAVWPALRADPDRLVRSTAERRTSPPVRRMLRARR